MNDVATVGAGAGASLTCAECAQMVLSVSPEMALAVGAVCSMLPGLIRELYKIWRVYNPPTVTSTEEEEDTDAE